MSDLKKRDFPSLRRKGTSIGGGGSFKPINTLSKPTSVVITEPNLPQRFLEETSSTRLIENTSPLGDPNRTIERAQSCRERLSGLNSLPSKIKHDVSDMDPPQIADCSGTPIDLEKEGLNDYPGVSIDLKSIRLGNGKLIKSHSRSQLSLGISNNGKFICIFQEDVPITGYIINIDTQLKSLSFALTSIVIEVNDFKDAIIVSHYGLDEEIRKYFHDNPCDKVDPSKTLADTALKKIDKIVEVEEDVIDPDYYGKIRESPNDMIDPSLDEVFSRLRTRNAKKAFWNRVVNDEQPNTDVKVVNSNETESIFVEDDYVSWEVPAKFDPDLQYIFPDGKLFRVSYNDFSTLYNNSWINDGVIDFCIKYDIEEAIEAGIVKREEIHAFNSFFYTKLNSNLTANNDSQYYQNIKRWVQKLDFMTIPYLVMPVNEKHHWYCCIIRGLPGLLSAALKKKQGESEPDETIKETSQEVEFHGTTPAESQDDKEPVSSQELVEPACSDKSRKEFAEIFVFDSLGLRRDNVKNPLKSFIVDYCRDKYDVEIQKDQIRVIAARVPRQNNYNDCGMHVIYNVKKWLFNLETCETLWRKYQYSVQRSIFIAEERNNSRRYWIDKFLELHAQQEHSMSKPSTAISANILERSEPHEGHLQLSGIAESDGSISRRHIENGVLGNNYDDDDDGDDDDDDDIIEIIEEKKINKSLPLDGGVATRTRKSMTKDQRHRFENNYLNKIYDHQNIPQFVINILNEVLPQRTLHFEMNVKNHIDRFINESKWRICSEEELKKQFVDELHTMMRESENGNRPKNKSFKIEERITTGVSHLSITPSTFFTKQPDDTKKLFNKETINFFTEISAAKEQRESTTSQVEESKKYDEVDGAIPTSEENVGLDIAHNDEDESLSLRDTGVEEVSESGIRVNNIAKSRITRSKDRERAKMLVLILLVDESHSPKRRRLE